MRATIEKLRADHWTAINTLRDSLYARFMILEDGHLVYIEKLRASHQDELESLKANKSGGIVWLCKPSSVPSRP